MALAVTGIDVFYGLSQALFGVSLVVGEGEAVALLGLNGAGKTTTMRSIMGFLVPRRGAIVYKGRNIVGWAPFQIARLGIGYVPEDRRIFPNLTTRENLEAARRRGEGGREYWDIPKILDLFPRLGEVMDRQGGYLSGGEQQMLAIARALMGNPQMLLLDEPSEGLAPTVIESLLFALKTLKREGISILISEQNWAFALALVDRVYIIERGEIRYQGAAEELIRSPELLRSYLAI
jgi:branched-chain amino acid transport system ATP-binding protein